MSFSLGLVGAATFNPLLNLLNTLVLDVLDKNVCVSKTFDPHPSTIPLEKQTSNKEPGSMVPTPEGVKSNHLLQQYGSLVGEPLAFHSPDTIKDRLNRFGRPSDPVGVFVVSKRESDEVRIDNILN